MVDLIFGLIAAIMFKACTTSGQFWQLNDMKVSKFISPSRLAICSITSASNFIGWPPLCNSANTNEVNSCPIGKPAKPIAVSLFGLITCIIGLRALASWSSFTMTLSLSDAMSFARPFSLFEVSLLSRLRTKCTSVFKFSK